jgi:hypothetical protein
VKKDKELVAKFLSTTVRTVKKIWKSAKEQEARGDIVVFCVNAHALLVK